MLLTLNINMNEYVVSIIGVSIIVGVCEMLVPKYSGIDKFFRMIGLLCILCVLINPIKNAINTFDNGFLDDLKEQISDMDNSSEKENYEEILNEFLSDHSIEQFKSQIKELLENDFNIPEEECEISVKTHYINNAVSVELLQIKLIGKSIFKNPYEIEEYFSRLLDCQCVVVIGE